MLRWALALFVVAASAAFDAQDALGHGIATSEANELASPVGQPPPTRAGRLRSARGAHKVVGWAPRTPPLTRSAPPRVVYAIMIDLALCMMLLIRFVVRSGDPGLCDDRTLRRPPDRQHPAG